MLTTFPKMQFLGLLGDLENNENTTHTDSDILSMRHNSKCTDSFDFNSHSADMFEYDRYINLSDSMSHHWNKHLFITQITHKYNQTSELPE